MSVDAGREKRADAAIPAPTVRAVIDAKSRYCPEAPFLIDAESGDVAGFGVFQCDVARLAAGLSSLGLRPGDRVGLLLENGLFTTKLLFGILYGGYVAVPLSVIAGPGQLEYCISHAETKVVFCAAEQRALADQCCGRIGPAVRVITVSPGCTGDWVAADAAEPLPAVAPGDDALIMYTSGTSGRPRGVLFSHGNLLAGVDGTIRTYGFSAADRALSLLPLYHLNALVTTYLPMLLVGGSVVVPRRFQVAGVWPWVAAHRCTWFAAVPGMISQLIEHEQRVPLRRPVADTLRFVRTSSAPITPQVQRAFEARFGVLLVEAMGMTEAGEVLQTPPDPAQRRIGSPGRPCHALRIVDADGQPVANGATGELQIRSPRVMKGYYRDPEATAQVLDDEGWLSTGDLGWRDDDGYVYIVGRAKDVVIKGGVNIAPREIDDALMSHPAVREAAAVGVPDPVFGEDLVAFVVRKAEREGMAGSPGELVTSLRRHCIDRIGEFKTPRHFRFVDDLPRGPSGKVQRARLRSQDTEEGTFEEIRPPSAREWNSPEDPEAGVRALWCEVLGLTDIDADRDFFEIGGNSLVAQRILVRVQERYGIDLPIRFMFENPSIRAMAGEVRARSDRDAGELPS
jgi:long-chain acyl-CoA synthetase